MSELDVVRLDVDELEALRLCDLEGHEQEAAGAKMAVSRGTVQRLLKSGREKVVGAVIRNSALVIGEGNVEAEVASGAD
jgi:predicted DNA-binding protein (UPF0251 family)